MPDSKRLDFLRVLIAAAWADGEMGYAELNQLKAYFRELDLDNHELTALQPYLVDPIGETEALTLIEDYLGRAGRGERATLLAAVRNLVVSDGELSPAEHAFLAELERAGAEAATPALFVRQLKRLWGGGRPAAAAPGRVRRSDLIDEFVRNRVLYQVKRRLLIDSGAAALDEATERELRYVCSLGALLGHVAVADREFRPEERAAIAAILDAGSSLPERDIDIIVGLVQSEVLADIGYLDFARELCALTSVDQRHDILALLFRVATADGKVSFEEHEEIRKISIALKIEHAAFIAAKQAVS
jgi:uncharacterized tellurite resistance protein B-like protein